MDTIQAQIILRKQYWKHRQRANNTTIFAILISTLINFFSCQFFSQQKLSIQHRRYSTIITKLFVDQIFFVTKFNFQKLNLLPQFENFFSSFHPSRIVMRLYHENERRDEKKNVWTMGTVQILNVHYYFIGEIIKLMLSKSQ